MAQPSESMMRAAFNGLCSACTVQSSRRLLALQRAQRLNLSTGQSRLARSSTFTSAKTVAARPRLPKLSDGPIGRRSGSTGYAARDPETGKFTTAEPEKPKPVLTPDNLFHPFSESPIEQIRDRAAYIKEHAYCPHPSHKQARFADRPEREKPRYNMGSAPPAHVNHECPDCGIPVYCCEEHWMDDYHVHLDLCDNMRQINEDDHDLRSGRNFPEFEYAGPQMEEAMVNMTNWDTFMYTRNFQAVNEDRGMRQVTRLLTYPVTIGSVLHELSPYNIRMGGRLTPEGLKSFSALRYNLHPQKSGAGEGIKGLRQSAPPVRIFVLGARAESSLPREVWLQLSHLFPLSKFHVILIGPEAMLNRDDEFPLPPRTDWNPFGAIVEDRIGPNMKISTIVDYYHTIHRANYFQPFDPYFDCFMLFHPGLGHPASSHDWQETLPMLLETKVPIISTGYTQYDLDRDVEWVHKRTGGEFDILLEPGENTFRSLRWEINDLDPQDITCGNWGVWAFRGKRYEATAKDVE